MNKEQLSLLAECMNTMEVFSEQMTGSLLSDLLAGRHARLFHITNQRKFTYLFNSLRDAGYITKTWIATAGHNCEFASVPQNLANDTTHFITSQQFTNCRRANKSQYIHGENTVEELMDKLPAL